MSGRKRYIPAGRLRDYNPPNPDRTSLRQGRSWDSSHEVQEWTSRGAMLTACSMTDTGESNALVMRPWPYPAGNGTWSGK